MTTEWTAGDAAALTQPDEVRVATRRSDGGLSKPRTIWIVGDGTRVFIRSTNGRGAAWFKGAVSRGSGQITAQGRTWDVTFHEVKDELTLAAADAGYRTKYRGYASIVDHLVGSGPRDATLQVDPPQPA